MENNIKEYHMINILRLVCAYLVIAIYLGAFGSVSEGFKTFTSDFICRIAVPFFFITSGYFFYFNVQKEGYLKKYIKKFVTIYMTTTIIHLIIFIPASMYLNLINNGVSHTIKALFVNGVLPSLWYFPALIVSIIIVNFFLKKNLIKPLMGVSIVLFIIGLMGDTYFGLIKNTSLVNIVNGYNFIFDNTRNGITFGIPFITIGALINKYKFNEKIKKPSRWFILFTIIYGIEAYTLISRGIPKDCNIYFSLALVVPIIFIMALNSKVAITKETSRYIREMSLWMYAFHELVYMLLCIYGLFNNTNSVFAYIFVCGVVTLIAYIITRIMLKGIVLNKTAARKIVLWSGIILIISLAMINANR